MTSRRKHWDKPVRSVDSTRISVICLGRGLHTKVSFGSLTVVAETQSVLIDLRADKHFVDIPEPDWSDPKSVAASLDVGVHTTYTMTCRRCRPPRRVPLTRSSLEKLATGLVAQDAPLDISALGAVGPISS